MDSESTPERGPLRLAVVGISLSTSCGVRDYAATLASALADEEVSCSFHWLLRSERSLRTSRAEIRAWTRELRRELDERRPDAILLHYSVFTQSHKGVPIFVRPVLSVLRRAGVPVVTVLHEFAYPWRYGGWRGAVWAVSQRAVLREVISASAAVLVTADFRARWLASRPWLPSRRVLSAPVSSALPAPTVLGPPPDRDTPVIGLFGYSYQGAAVSLVLDAIGELGALGTRVRLTLLGAPGPSSSAAAAWLAQAQARGLDGVLSFTGTLPAQELSDALAACEILLFADSAGPSSRKSTLAASLASGRPVIALDGPTTWSELLDAEALMLVAPSSRALAEAISGLLGDAGARGSLGARGRAFSETEMAVTRSARATRALIEQALAAGRS
jgi:glycosyltransferase involved in cell wall biosynthesis